jgi:replicative superfamily II helicase
VESLFQRSDGVDVLVATPTLAQGMNLPAEAVILAGDERWDGEQNNQENLKAHEMLNAAGRAGRAGYSAKGFVLVIPNRIVSLEYSDNGEASIGQEWTALKERIFSKSDQCLTVIDPLKKLLDAVRSGVLTDETAAHYLFRRMPYRNNQADEDSVRDILNKSLAAFVAKQKGQVDDFNAMIEATVQASHGIRNFDDLADSPWMGKLATEIGVDISVIKIIYNKLDELSAEFTVYNFLDWANELNLLILLAKHSSHADIVQTLTTTQERQQEDKHAIAYGRLIDGLKAWCGGATIVEISGHMLETARTQPRCKNSRKLIARWVPEVAFALGSVARMYKYKSETEGLKMPLCLAILASLIRHGVDSSEKLALLYLHNYQLSRPKIRSLYDEIASQIPVIEPFASFRDVLIAVKAAHERHILNPFNGPTF